MVRQVAYRKAWWAGMAGAAAWEAVARLGLAAGLPLPDMVHLLGTMLLPQGAPWQWWLAGMAVHLLVGALWAVFYACFFWALLPLRPVLQGLVFAFIPMPLAIFSMRPQLELMNPLVLQGVLGFSGRFGHQGGWAGPLGVALGHLVWGATLGALYTRPVGRPAAQSAPRRRSPPHGAPPRPPSAQPELRFLFSTGIECSYPTLEAGRWRLDQMEATGHDRRWRQDLQLVRELGAQALRYGPPLHRSFLGPGRFDWSFTDEVVDQMQQLQIEPIMDLCHFGLPTWLGDFQNPEVPAALAEYAGAFAARYAGVRLYTPVNEMYVCARLSALEGAWNEQRRDEVSFVTAARHLAGASVRMMQAIAQARPQAIFVNSESSEFYQPCCPDPRICAIAAFENERRFLPLDLLYARPVGAPMREQLRRCGMPDEGYAWFMNQDVRRRAILGVDYYDWNEKVIDHTGAARALGELFGWMVIARQYHDRYGRPLMHTETNHMDAREAPRWLWRQWHNVQLMRSQVVPVLGFTWYSLTDQVDWDVGLRSARGIVNPVGLFDLNRDPRPVGQAYQHLIHLFASEMAAAPRMEDVLRAAERTPGRKHPHA